MIKNNIFLLAVFLLTTSCYAASERPTKKKKLPVKKDLTLYMGEDVYLATIADEWLVELNEMLTKKMKYAKNKKNPFVLDAHQKLNNLTKALYDLKTTNIENLRALPDEQKSDGDKEKTK